MDYYSQLKLACLLYYEEAFNEKMDACKKTKVNASIFSPRMCFCLKIIQIHFYNLCSSNLYIYKFPSYVQDVQKLLQMMSFKAMVKDVNMHVGFIFFLNCLKIIYLKFFCSWLLIFTFFSFYFEWFMLYEIWFHYREDAIIDGVFYATFAIVYTCVKVNIHPTHDGNLHTMQSHCRCHTYIISYISLKLK
jgi:hypothetical protein